MVMNIFKRSKSLSEIEDEHQTLKAEDDELGTKLSIEKKKVAIAFDLDQAGRKGYMNIRNYMFHNDIRSYRVKPEYGNDLNDSWVAGMGLTVLGENESDAVLDRLNLPFPIFN